MMPFLDLLQYYLNYLKRHYNIVQNKLDFLLYH